MGKAERVLIIYGDVIVDRHLMRRVLEAKEDIVVVVDDSYKNLPTDRDIDRVKLDWEPSAGIRRVDTGQLHEVLAIGRETTEEEATHEFVGFASLSKEACRAAAEKFKSDAGGAKWTVPDLVGKLMKDGRSVHALAVTSGWKEIHTFEHYREASMLFR